MRRQLWIAAIGLAAIQAACTSIETPTGTPAALPSGPTSPAASPGTPTPAVSPPPPTASSSELGQVQRIPETFTTPALAYATDGDALLWSSGAPDLEAVGAAHLWFYVPESGEEPRLLYVNPTPDSDITIIGGDGAGNYAFVEQNLRVLGDSGWRLWHTTATGPAHVIDEGDEPNGLLPFFSMDDGRIAWAVVHRDGDTLSSQLFLMDLETRTRTLIQTRPAEEEELLYPSLDGSFLVYSSLRVNDDGALEPSVFSIDLDAEGAVPRQLNGDGPAFRGVVRGDSVVWYEPVEGLSPLNGGPLVEFSLRDEVARPIPMEAIEGLYLDPSLGDRFVAGDRVIGPLTDLTIYDIATGEVLVVQDAGDQPEGERTDVFVRPHIAGSILAYVRGSDLPGRHLSLEYVRLPER